MAFGHPQAQVDESILSRQMVFAVTPDGTKLYVLDPFEPKLFKMCFNDQFPPHFKVADVIHGKQHFAEAVP